MILIVKYIYSYNGSVKYDDKIYKDPIKDFSKLKLYYNESDLSKIDSPDLFSNYPISVGCKFKLTYGKSIRLSDENILNPIPTGGGADSAPPLLNFLLPCPHGLSK